MSLRRSSRHRGHRLNGSSPKVSSNSIAVQEYDTAEEADEDKRSVQESVQGLCDVVRVLFDNLRPTEEQLHESDFLDQELSGDEDWNGDSDDMYGEDGYAW